MATEQTVQTALFNIELGRGKTVLQWVVVVLAALTLSLIYTASQFRGLDKREAMDMAQLARNIARGEGFTTSVIRPVSLWHLQNRRPDHDPHFDHHPDLYNPPLYPLVLAGLFRLMPANFFEAKPTDLVYSPERWVILPFNQLCMLLSVVLVYFWARQMFDQRLALTVGWLLLFSDTLWSYSISGLPTTFLMLLLLLSMYCLFRADQRLNPPGGTAPAPLDTKTIGLIVASAVLMGLCFLTRYLSAFLLVPMAIYVARAMRGRRAGVWVALYVAVFVVVIAPWLLRNYQVSRSLLGVARYQFFATEAFDRTYTVDMNTAWQFRSIVPRFLTQLRSGWLNTFRHIGSDVFVFFFVVGVMYGFRRGDASRLRRILLACLITGLVGMAIIGQPGELVNPDVNGGNLLVLLLPLVAVFGCAFFYLLLDRIAFSMKLIYAAAVGAFALLNVAPIIFTLLPPRRAMLPYPPYSAPHVRVIAPWFEKEEVGVSDMPWAVAWYVDRRTLWLPLTPEEYVQIHDFVAPHNTQFVLLTPYMLDRRNQSEIMKGEFKPWAAIIHGQLTQNFPFKIATLMPPEGDLILFTDRRRWKEKLETNTTDAATSSKNEDQTAPDSK